MMVAGANEGDLDHWQRLDGGPVVENAASPRPPSGVTPKGSGDPRQASLFALLEDRPPAGVPADVAELFEKLALEAAAAGFQRYSSNMLVNRIRWHFQIERGNRDFKINDHVSPVLSRWFLARHPEMPGFFELRERDVTKIGKSSMSDAA